MACGACGNRKTAGVGSRMEYLVTYGNGSTERVPDLATARQRLALSEHGGSYRLVPAAKK